MDPSMGETDEAGYQKLLENRRREKPYRDRRVHVVARELLHEARYSVRHEGPGLDPSALPDLRDPTIFDKISGRALLLIRTFMDQVTHDQTGKEMTLVKRRD